jgi:hypothetical protein
LVSLRLPFVVAVLCVATSATAAPLPFVGNLHLQIGVLEIDVPSSGTAEISPNGFSLQSGVFATVGLVTPVPSSVAAINFPIVSVQGTFANGPGAFARYPNNAWDGVMPLPGIGKVCLFAACSSAIANVSVPLNVVGLGGQVAASGPVNVTVAGAPWTTASVTGIHGDGQTFYTRGFHHGPNSLPGSTLVPGGVVQLVTPIFIQTNLDIYTPAFAAMTLHFVPESGTGVLVGTGVVLMAWRGKRLR